MRLIVRRPDCRHQVEPDPAEIPARYGAEMPVPTGCSLRSQNVDMVVSGTERG